MKALMLLILLTSSLFAQAQYEQIVWPERIYPHSILYRGQNTGHKTFASLIEVLLGKQEAFIGSRLFRSLVEVFPAKSEKEIANLVDRQLRYYRAERLLGQITYCHAGVYDCDMPTVTELQGPFLKDEQLPADIAAVKQRQINGGRLYESVAEAERVLSFFDPVVSTSWNETIAKKFAQDRSGYKGYVLLLQDIENRHCPLKRKEKGRCFINHEEYLDELEYPFFGYIKTNEFYGFERFGVRIQKTFQDRSKLEVYFPYTQKRYELVKGERGFLGLFWKCPEGAKKFYQIPPIEKRIIRALRKQRFSCLIEQGEGFAL